MTAAVYMDTDHTIGHHTSRNEFPALGATGGNYDDNGLDEEYAMRDMVDAAANVEFDDQRLAEALALFEKGDYVGAEAAAVEAEDTARTLAARKVAIAQSDIGSMGIGSDGSATLQDPGTLGVIDDAPKPGDDDWKITLDLLANAYADAARTENAEALYLRMLAWRGGVEQYRAGHFSVAEQLFKKSPEYKTVEDATWFLRGLRPDDGHAVPEVVGLLALGEQVAAKAAVAVWTLALRPKQRPRITECGGLELVAKAVAYHVENPELQAAGCGALRLLCSGHQLAARNRRVLVERLGGAEALTASMRCHPQDPEVQREACGALQVACTQNPSGARRVVDSDGMMLCLEAIAACPHDEGVGKAACRALTSMQCAGQISGAPQSAGEDFEATWENKMRTQRERCLAHCDEELRRYLQCADRPVIEALLTAVNIFLEDAGVRHRGCTDDIDGDIRPLMEPVVAAMTRFQGQAAVQVPGCGIIALLTAGHSARDEAVAQFAQSGGIMTICQAMKDLACNEDVQRLGVGAIRNVAVEHDQYKTLAVRAGAIPMTVTAMLRYPRNTILQEQAIGALTHLCDTVGRAAVCARLGGIEAVIAALRRHTNVGHIAELGCIVLCMFCDDAQLRQQIVRSGALSIAKALSRTGASEAQRWGCELLRDLSDSHV